MEICCFVAKFTGNSPNILRCLVPEELRLVCDKCVGSKDSATFTTTTGLARLFRTFGGHLHIPFIHDHQTGVRYTWYMGFAKNRYTW